MVEGTIGRVVKNTEASDIFAAAEWILGIPRIQTEAIGVCTGLGEVARVTHAIAKWRGSGAYLLLTGTNAGEKTFDGLTRDRLAQKPYRIPLGSLRVFTQINAQHTPAQATWLVGQMAALDLRSCELHAPPYHMVRAYLTVLANMDRNNPFILTAHPTPMPPAYVVPETGAQAVDMTAGEYERIAKYQSKGDVATLEQLKEYLAWLWQQPEFSEFL